MSLLPTAPPVAPIGISAPVETALAARCRRRHRTKTSKDTKIASTPKQLVTDAITATFSLRFGGGDVSESAVVTNTVGAVLGATAERLADVAAEGLDVPKTDDDVDCINCVEVTRVVEAVVDDVSTSTVGKVNVGVPSMTARGIATTGTRPHGSKTSGDHINERTWTRRNFPFCGQNTTRVLSLRH